MILAHRLSVVLKNYLLAQVPKKTLTRARFNTLVDACFAWNHGAFF